VTKGLGEGLSARGIEVVSGGARGIDATAHLAVLEAGGRTVAVLGSGLARPYPECHRELFERVAGSGAVISEFPLDESPARGNFPRRNRLISGLAAAVVVVEATRRSGSLITAGHALEQGREVQAVPGPVTSEHSAGTNWLIQQGAKRVQNVEDVVVELPPPDRVALAPAPSPAAAEDDARAGLLPDEETVLRLLDEVEPVHLDELAERVPFGIARLQTALFGLEFRGAAESRPGGFFLRVPLPRPRRPESIR
jgi:DNA processing protein